MITLDYSQLPRVVLNVDGVSHIYYGISERMVGLCMEEISTEVAREDLQAVSDFLTEERWCQGYLAESADGKPVSSPFHEDASRWCLLGALARVIPEPRLYGIHGAMDRVMGVILTWGFETIGSFNDNSRTQYSTVVDVLKEALLSVG